MIPEVYQGEDWSDVHGVMQQDYSKTWMQRDNACKKVSTALRRHLLSQYFGKPVIEVREKHEEIRQNNTDFVKMFMENKELKFTITWKISYEYFVKDGIPTITDFNVVVT